MIKAISPGSDACRSAAVMRERSVPARLALLLTLILTHGLVLGFPAPVRAQLMRYELGRRVQNLEAAWDAEGNEPRRAAALPLIQEAVKNFFALNQADAALKISDARWQLVGGTIPPQQRLADQIMFEPTARLVDLRDLDSFQVVGKGFRPDVAIFQLGLRYELRDA
ncbi:MAG: hypothetical protein ACKPEY_20805, partial [Planctomycetota bacterium]